LRIKHLAIKSTLCACAVVLTSAQMYKFEHAVGARLQPA